MKTIIYSHPYTGSFNHAILEKLEQQFSKEGLKYQVIDLYADKFDPVMSVDEMLMYSKGKTDDGLVKKYQGMISSSDELIFVFPIWWHNMPAITKGFIDKVMLNNFAYEESNGWKGLLSYIKKATVITTSTITKEYLVKDCGDPIQGVFINRTLNDMGIDPKNVDWIHLGKVNLITNEERVKFLNDLRFYVK